MQNTVQICWITYELRSCIRWVSGIKEGPQAEEKLQERKRCYTWDPQRKWELHRCVIQQKTCMLGVHVNIKLTLPWMRMDFRSLMPWNCEKFIVLGTCNFVKIIPVFMLFSICLTNLNIWQVKNTVLLWKFLLFKVLKKSS